MPSQTTPYDQLTQGDRLIRIAGLSRDGFTINFFPDQGVIPPTWNLLGQWFLGSRTADPTGEYVAGFIYANQQQYVTQRFLDNFIDTSTSDIDVLRFRFRPYIPSGNVVIFTTGTITP